MEEVKQGVGLRVVAEFDPPKAETFSTDHRDTMSNDRVRVRVCTPPLR